MILFVIPATRNNIGFVHGTCNSEIAEPLLLSPASSRRGPNEKKKVRNARKIKHKNEQYNAKINGRNVKYCRDAQGDARSGQSV